MTLQTSLNKLCLVYPKLGNSFKGFVNIFYDFGDRKFHIKTLFYFLPNNEKDFLPLYFILHFWHD